MARPAALSPLALLVLLAAARGETPIPPYPQNGVAVAGVADRFDPLREHLRRFQSQAGADYRVCVVALTDPQDRPGRDFAASAVPYVDAVSEAWAGSLDAQRSVVIVLALENRGIAVHPGSRWTRLGFEQATVTQVIEASPFATYARAGDHVQALERLIEAIDMHLALRQQQDARALEAATARLKNARARLADLERSAQADLDAGEARAALAEAPPLLAAAANAIGNQAGGEAVGHLEALERGLKRAEGLLQAAARRREELARLRKAAPNQLAAARARAVVLRNELGAPGPDGVDLSPLLPELERVEALLRDADALLAAEQLPAVVERAARAEDWLHRLELRREELRAAHRFRTRTLPLLGAGAALAALALLLGLLRLIRQAKHAEARRLVEAWREKLQVAAPRLLELEDGHPLLFGTPELGKRLRGASGERFRAVGAAVDELFLRYAAAQERLLEAEQALALTPPFGWGPSERARGLLGTTPVVVGKARVEGTRLFLPEVREVTCAPPELLDALERAWGEAREAVAGLEDVLQRVPRRLGAAEETRAALVAGLGALAARGVALPAWDAVQGELDRRLEARRDQVLHDPLLAEAALAEDEAALGAARERLERAGRALDLAAQAEAGLRAQAERVATERARGLALLEPGFEPEALLEEARGQVQGARQAVDAAEDVAGLARAERAGELLAELTARVDETLRARAEGPGWVAGLRREREELAGALPERRERLQGLRREHQDEALRPALDNAEEAEAALGFVLRCLDEADLALGAERYLAAGELVARARTVLGEVRALYAEVEVKAQELGRCRQAAEAARGRAAADLSQLELLLVPGDRFLTQASLDQVCALRASVHDELAAQGQERPHWPQRQGAAEALRDQAARVLQRVQAEHRAHQEAERETRRALAEAEALERLLAGSEDDRPLANQHAGEARARLGAARELSAAQRPDWVEVLALVQGGLLLLHEGRRHAELDLSLAQAARQAVAQAQSEVERAAQERHAHGVTADLAPARSLLEQARAALVARGYEDAARRALEAQGQAERGAREARAEVQRRQEAEERRRREAAEAARRRAAAASFSYSSSSRSSSSRSSSFGSSRSSSGGSRSGGSSYRSSSGGSSYRSSSGGSSW